MALDDEKNNPLFRLPLLEIGIAPSEPLKKVFHLSKVSIQSPELNLVRNQAGVLNIESRFPKVEERIEAIKKGETPPTTIDVDEIELRGGKVSFSDLSRKKPFKTILSPIELKVDHFSNGKDKKTAYALSITSEAKENINLEGELSVEPLWAEGGLEIKSVPDKEIFTLLSGPNSIQPRGGAPRFLHPLQICQRERKNRKFLSRECRSFSIPLRLKRPDEKEDFLKIPLLSVKDTLVDLTQKKLTVGTFSTEKGNLICNRLKNGDFDLSETFPPSPPKDGTCEAGKRQRGREEMDRDPGQAFCRSIYG